LSTWKKTFAALAITLAWTLPARADIVKLKGYPSQNTYIETLRIELFYPQNEKDSFWTQLSVWDASFFSKGSEKSVRVLQDRTKLTYKVWMQDEIAPLAIILPGFGGHYNSQTATAQAYKLYCNGYSTLIISSPTNFEFMNSAGKNIVPGYTPYDAQDIYNALQKVIADLKSRYGAERISKKVLIGLSLGALHSLFISDIDNKQNKIGFERFIALNPPIDVFYALEQIDQLMAIWQPWSREKLDAKTNRAGVTFWAMFERRLSINAPLPIDKSEAEYMIGISFRMTLRDMIFNIHKRKNFGILKAPYSWCSRDAMYREINQFNFSRYIETFGKKYYTKVLARKFSKEQMNKESSLPSIGASLAANPKVRVIYSINDFMAKKSDLEWLRNLLGEKMTVFNQGSHLGYLYRPQAQKQILKYLNDKAFADEFELVDDRASAAFNEKLPTYISPPYAEYN